MSPFLIMSGVSTPHRDNLNRHGKLYNNTGFFQDTLLSIFLRPSDKIWAEKDMQNLKLSYTTMQPVYMLKKEVNVPEPSVQLAVTDQCMPTAQADKCKSGIFGKF